MGKYENPEISIHSVSFMEYVTLFEAGKWEDVANMMLA
jgi:hypothetical protein